MKTAKLNTFVIAGLIYLAGSLSNVAAQNCDLYFPLVKGAAYEFDMTGPKQKKTGRMVYLIHEVSKQPDKTEAQITHEFYDEKNKKSVENTYTLFCNNNGQVMIDMRAFMNPQIMQPYQNMDVKMEGDYLMFPADLQVGESLPEGNMTMTMSDKKNSASVMPMMRLRIYNRTVEGKEPVTCAAGTFDCLKITYDLTLENLAIGIPITMHMKATDWIAPGKGLIKSESFRGNGKSVGTTVLAKTNQQ